MKARLMLLLLVLSSLSHAAIYYIDPSGNDATGSGSLSSPWKTLTYACSHVTTFGDIIHIKAGTYPLTAKVALSAGVSIEGDGVTSIITSSLAGSGSGAAAWTIQLNSSMGTNGNQHISNIKMDGLGLTGWGAIGINGRSNVKIYNCTFVDFSEVAIMFNGAGSYISSAPSTFATGNEFHDNIVTNCASYRSDSQYGSGNLMIGGQGGLLVYNNTITQTGRAAGLNGYCIKYYSEGYNKGVKIYGNTLTTSPSAGIHPSNSWGFVIELWNSIGGIEIYNNQINGCIDLVNSSKGTYTKAFDIHNNLIGWNKVLSCISDGEVGLHFEGNASDIYIYDNHFNYLSMPMYFSSATGNTLENIYVYYNIFENVGTADGSYKGWGIRAEGSGTITYNNWNILNNVFSSYQGGTSSSMWGVSVPQCPNKVSTNITIRNNIIINFDYAGVVCYPANLVSIENNIFYGNGNSNDPRNSTGLTNLTIANNIKKDPGFVSSTDFRLQSGSPAINAGIGVGLTQDYLGNAVDLMPDIGAYEYNSGSTSTPIPVYQSASVENATPGILTMTYSLSLSNVVPAASAFSVQVNSANRSVNSVSIVGGKVQLTLASPVIYGDVITVAYTVPSSNQLQTAAGGIAVSITAKPVTNNMISNIPVYSGSSIENTTPSLLTMTYDLTLASVIPAVSAFSVQVNSVSRSINSVTISGTKVQLTLSSPVVYGDVVTVAYTKPATNPLQSTSGGLAVSISGKSVTNNCSPVAPVYVSSVIQNNTPSILEITYDLSLANVVPSTSAFSVQVNSVTRSVSSVAIVSGKVQLTLSTPVVYGDAVKMSYTAPASKPLQTASGGLAVSISNKTVTNNCLPVAPVYVGSVIQNATPSILEMTYDLNLANVVPATSAFTVQVNSATRSVSSVAIVNGKVQLTLSTPVVYADVITVSYTAPATKPLQTASGGLAVSISAKTVTNNCASPIPVYVSSVIDNATPSMLQMTYSLSLANIIPPVTAFSVKVNSVSRTVNSVAIVSGNVQLTLATPVVSGDIVTVSYTAPASNPLQTATGGLAASISSKSVTNNCISPIPVYVSSVIENAAPAVLEMTYSSSLANVVPATSAFSVHVNSLTRSIISVAIVSGKVQLTLASSVVYGDVITVAYTLPTINPLQTPSGVLATSISAQTVTNNCLAPVPVYVSSVIEDATPSILAMTYSLSLANVIPSASAFSVKVNSVTRSVSSVSINGVTVQLTLASPVVNGDVVTVSYTKPSVNPLQTSSGAQAVSLSTNAVKNNCLPVVPVYVSSVIEDATPSILEMTYSLSLANVVPATSSFNVQVNSFNRAVNSVAIVGGKVQLTLASGVVYGDVITITYSVPSSNPLQTASGGIATGISTKPVTNNCIQIIPAYVSSVIENATPSLLEITYSITLANIVPANSAFTVRVNNVTRTVTSVAIVGTKVQLTLTSPVKYGDIITLAYSKPSNNPLQTTSGAMAVTFSAKSVTNNCVPVDPVYVSSVIQNATPSLLEMTYSLNLANIIPSASAFNVKVNSLTRNVITVAIVNGKVQLTLASAVVYGDVITVAYTTPSSNLLQTSSGGLAASMSAQPVTNNCISPTPVYVSSVIQDATPSLLEMTYSLTLANIVPAVSSFNVRVNSVTRTISLVEIINGNVRLTLASPAVYGDIITVSYTQPAGNPLQTASGGLAQSLSAQPVTNNCISPIPVYLNSVVENATPTLLEMTYNLNLAAVTPATSSFNVQVNSLSRSVSSVAIISGKVQLTLSSPVIYGDIITVGYTVPGSNPLQSTEGGLAVSISNQSVTNNCISPIPVYISSVIENATPTILEMTYNISLANIVPSRNAFSVRVNSASRSISSVAIVNGKVRLTLSSPVVFGDIVTVSYTRPYTNQLQTSAGKLAASIYGKSVNNNCISQIPVYIGSVIENATPSLLEMTYDLSLASIVPVASSFNVMVNSVTRTVTSVVVSGYQVRLTLTSPVVYGDFVTISYTAPGANPLQTPAGVSAENLSATQVTNNCISIVPVYVSSVIENTTPTSLEMTFDLNLANIIPALNSFDVEVNSEARAVTAVAIANGKVRLTLDSAAIYGDIITITYNKPAINPLQTISGGVATSIYNEPVTNNCVSSIPVYVNSIIENDFPSIIEMNYNISLDDIVPATASFNVLVNSVPVAVSSVTIVDDMVRLTLESAVEYGDLVTIDYTAPAINSLQSLSGGQAADITAQPVTNNCLSSTPVYISSIIQNDTPNILDISYNLSLENIVPDTSYFKVLVNSVKIAISSVSVLNNIVRLTLTSAIDFGDLVTVAYTVPDTNPLQTASGETAASLNDVPVTNNCQDVPRANTPPFIIIKNETDTSFSGFVYELDATKSYDLDNDFMIYEWTLPDNVTATSTNSPKIQFLAPIVSSPRYIEFLLKVSDGKSISSKVIQVNIMPYKPEYYTADISDIEVSDFQVPNYKNNVIDNDIKTNWSAIGDNQWLRFSLANSFKINYLEIGFLDGQKYSSYFDIYASKDNLSWDRILLNVSSCDFSGDIQVFDVPDPSKNTEYSYVKLIGHGNSLNSWNNFSEIKIFGQNVQNPIPVESKNVKIKIYPNPVQDFLNISVTEATFQPCSFKIINYSGNTVFEGLLEQGIKTIQIPGNIKSGAYLIEFSLGNLLLDAQKLIIKR
jgi:uncharacterized repeat protein (TIGR02059 family)